MKKTMLIGICLLLTLSTRAFGGQCGLVIPDRFEEYNDVQLHGYYFHPDHCFSVVIPKSVTGRDHSEPQSHHGFGAVLSKEPHAAYLYVGAEPAGILDDENGNTGTLASEARQRLQWLKDEGAIILQHSQKKTIIGGLPAVRFIAVYKCHGSSEKIVEDDIITAKGILFELTLTAAEPAYKSARRILDEMAKTWKLESKKCEREFQKRLKE